MTSSFHLGPAVQAPLYCLCQQPFEGITFMVACDHCNQWYHGKCVNITEEEAKKAKGGYVCPPCKSKMESETQEATLKRLREENVGGGGGGGGVMVGDPSMSADPGTPTAKRRKAQHQRGERFCRFPGCDKRISCRSYCSRHQKQKERAGKRGKIFSTATSTGRRSCSTSGGMGRPSKNSSSSSSSSSSFSPSSQGVPPRSPRQPKMKRFEDKASQDYQNGGDVDNLSL